MSKIRQYRDPKMSLFQSAVSEVAARHAGVQTLSVAGGNPSAIRPSTDDPFVATATDFLDAAQGGAPMPDLPPPTAALGVVDVAKYCANISLKLGEALGKALLTGNDQEVQQCRDRLGKFGQCDPRWREAAEQYANYFVVQQKNIPYIRHAALTDFVIDGKLGNNARIAIVGDWGTGQDVALLLLKQIERKNPDVVIHLGDIYYAGTLFEVDNYFWNPWNQILQLQQNPNRLTFTLAGNHDMYSGGQAFYGLLKKLGQPASYFCLRNNSWQLICMDTGLHDSNPLGTEPTMLEATEVEWVRDKLENNGGRRSLLLSHHQLFTAYEKIHDKYFNDHLQSQLGPVLSNVALWIWGHEHNFVVYEKCMGVLARCLGHGAFPMDPVEIPTTPVWPEVPVNESIKLAQGSAFYRHGYMILDLNAAGATASYYQDSDETTPMFSEPI
jgi:predicted phosphodiesterase